MSGLVDQLLLLSRLDDIPKSEMQKLVRLDRIVSDAIDMATPLARKNNIQIESAFVPISVIANESQLRQVMLNLIANAIQFSHLGGVIAVKLQHNGANATIEVRDNGIGIARENLPRVYDRFFQVNQARTTTYSSGSGLGLSIVSEIVQQAGGTVSIQSELGIGTNVCIVIPIGMQPTKQPTTESDRDPVK